MESIGKFSWIMHGTPVHHFLSQHTLLGHFKIKLQLQDETLQNFWAILDFTWAVDPNLPSTESESSDAEAGPAPGSGPAPPAPPAPRLLLILAWRPFLIHLRRSRTMQSGLGSLRSWMRWGLVTKNCLTQWAFVGTLGLKVTKTHPKILFHLPFTWRAGARKRMQTLKRGVSSH